jgi:hypothetical protein
MRFNFFCNAQQEGLRRAPAFFGLFQFAGGMRYYAGAIEKAVARYAWGLMRLDGHLCRTVKANIAVEP